FGALVTQAFMIAKDKDALKVNTEADKGFAVVELFTSEGCSSCPPADALVAKVQKESEGKPVYILAYHVDYWNRLGWKDAFSDAAYSARQKQYARWIKGAEIYTPQAVINGRKEFIGSQEGTLRSTIKADLTETTKTELFLNDLSSIGGKITFKYHIQNITNNSSLVVALVEKNAISKVMKGENAGRTLSHVQIVRELRSVNPGNNNNGSVSLPLPGDFNGNGYEVIAFVQNTTNGEITGAAKALFSSTLSK
ncbi:MAG TPA: DUF1223 domain-containing protein, partial [Mucilaginibacter sp.]|nr:DUF1223 domain-containing protein [Mucilaginibacter sp.]